MKKPFFTFVVPIKNEEKSIEILVQEITHVCADLQKSCEILFIDDGSTDTSFQILKKLAVKNPSVKVIRLRRWFGKSEALSAGFAKAQGNLVVTLDGDLQDDPQELPKFLSKIDEGYDLVLGWKKIRHDPLGKTLPSKVINYAVRKLTGLNIHDVNCGFKVYRNEVVKDLNIYGDLYRFIPILAHQKGYSMIEVAVNHRARRYGKSKYGWQRFMIGFLDLLTVFFLTKYLHRPGHFFGTIGSALFSIGFLIGLYISYLRFTTGSIQFRQPLLFLGMLLLIIGVQCIMTGLLADMIIFFARKEDKNSIIKEEINL